MHSDLQSIFLLRPLCASSHEQFFLATPTEHIPATFNNLPQNVRTKTDEVYRGLHKHYIRRILEPTQETKRSCNSAKRHMFGWCSWVTARTLRDLVKAQYNWEEIAQSEWNSTVTTAEVIISRDMTPPANCSGHVDPLNSSGHTDT